MTQMKNIHGHLYPPFHSGWGSFAEELFHYTSRYYLATEAFLRNLSGDRAFSMTGYKADRLSVPQRDLMAVVLTTRPDADAAGAVISIVGEVLLGSHAVDSSVEARYATLLDKVVEDTAPHQPAHGRPTDKHDVAPLDPFLNIAERLQMPVAVCDHHVEVSLHSLAEHLDSANATLRANLQAAVIQLHNAGYVLRNHPHLMHSEAHAIADGDAV